MNNDTERATQPEASSSDVILLGVASTDTLGGPLVGEEMGGYRTPGISHE